MIHRIFTIYDTKGEFYSPPFHQKTVGLAIRAFKDTATDQATSIAHHPEDFTLYSLGEYDDRTGLFKTNTPVVIMRANETDEGPIQ